ncbi:hypothetical protein GQ600_6032 [Phytophthora cactorum]|nr:hypothetical protein GQ600_6032 [Phytophthora cactorum]
MSPLLAVMTARLMWFPLRTTNSATPSAIISLDARRLFAIRCNVSSLAINTISRSSACIEDSCRDSGGLRRSKTEPSAVVMSRRTASTLFTFPLDMVGRRMVSSGRSWALLTTSQVIERHGTRYSVASSVLGLIILVAAFNLFILGRYYDRRIPPLIKQLVEHLRSVRCPGPLGVTQCCHCVRMEHSYYNTGLRCRTASCRNENPSASGYSMSLRSLSSFSIARISKAGRSAVNPESVALQLFNPFNLPTAPSSQQDGSSAATLILPANVLDSIAAVLTDFLVSDIPLSKAIELSHVGSSPCWTCADEEYSRRDKAVDGLLPSCFRWEFSLALVQAIRRADLNMVQWLLSHCSGCLVEKEVVEEDTCGRCNYWKTINRMEELNGETRAWSKQQGGKLGCCALVAPTFLNKKISLRRRCSGVCILPVQSRAAQVGDCRRVYTV